MIFQMIMKNMRIQNKKTSHVKILKYIKIPNIFYLEESELNEGNKYIYDIEMRGDKQNN